MNSSINFDLIKSVTRFFILIPFVIIVNCSNLETEKTYCLKSAEKYFLLCLVNVTSSPSYFGRPEWSSSTIQSYAQTYCLVEYNRKKRCVGENSPFPHKKD